MIWAQCGKQEIRVVSDLDHVLCRLGLNEYETDLLASQTAILDQ